MSRTNPYKKKSRYSKYTVFTFGEGETEEAFIRFLKGIYCYREMGISVSIDNAGGGGTYIDILKKAKRRTSNAQYNLKFILMDQDISGIKKVNKVEGFILIPVFPCIEGFFITILEPKKKISSWNSKKCKKYFHDNYLTETEKLDFRNYSKIFLKQKLEARRKNNIILNQLINFLSTPH